ncbi:MAG: molybdate ABC transporter substrate-binding protein [Microthrixaceae bacterium]
MRKTRTIIVAGAMSALVVVAGCTKSNVRSSTTTAPTGSASRADGSNPATSPVTGSIVVSAAASLTEVFGVLRDGFLRENPEASVTINFGSSGQLAAQILDGAPVDVAAFADPQPMTSIEDAKLTARPSRIFARNRLVIVTKPGNPRRIRSLGDLRDVGTVSLCADTAPCGKFADEILRKADVSVAPTRITRGPDVKATLRAVTEGDADAAIVYVTDATAAGRSVASVQIATGDNVVASYPIATLENSGQLDTARAFEDYILGPAGRRILAAAGFQLP